MGICRLVAAGTGIASEYIGEGEGVRRCCLRFADFPDGLNGRVGEGGLDEREESLSRKGSRLIEAIKATSACEGVCCSCGMGGDG